MRRLLILFGLVFCLINSVYALTYSNITLNTSVSNTSMTFDSVSMSIDSVQIESDFIYSTNISYVNGNFNVTLISNYNHSIANNNIDSSEFPYLNTVTSSLITIYNNLTETVNVNVVISGVSEPEDVRYTSNNGTYTKTYSASEYSWSANKLTINITGIEPGANNQLDLSAIPAPSQTGGGGGTPTIDLSATKTHCDWTIDMEKLFFDDSINNNVIKIKSKETFNVNNLTYNFEHNSGSLKLFNELAIEAPNVVYPNVVERIYVNSKKTQIGEADGLLIISSNECIDIEIPIFINYETPILTTEDLTDNLIILTQGNVSTINLLNELSNDKIEIAKQDRSINSIFNIFNSFLGLGVIFSLALAFVFWRKEASPLYVENTFFDIVIRLVFWFISSAIVLGILWLIKVTYFGGSL